MTDALSAKSGIELAESQRIAWLRLIRSQNVGPATFLELIKRYGTASNALEALPELAAKARGKSIKIASQDHAEQELERLHHMGAKLICIGEPDYPAALRMANTPPPVLTVRGSCQVLERHAVAFVGARNASLSGIKMTKQLVSPVAKQGYAIVSGLARGIDAAAHSASLQEGTIAVFAGSIDHIYPHENHDLAHAIIDKGGALISEMPLGWKPRAQDFPRRNRIVAGIALGLVVVEAARRSGSLISARLANEMGRLVFAVPGSPLDSRSEGANHLLKQGAQLITNAEDILTTLTPLSESPLQSIYTLDEQDDDFEASDPPNSSDRQALLNALDRTPTDIDELIRFTGIEPAKMQLLLLELTLDGQVERDMGNRVSLI